MVTHIFSERAAQRLSFAEEFISGLLPYLLLTLILKSLGLNWVFAAFLPYGVTLFGDTRSYFRGLTRLPRSLTPNHSLWLVVQIIIGLTLFDYFGGAISTAWRNAYGDEPFHFSMIASFAFADNFPPQQVIFSGEPLSYPFFVNLWSASLWFWDQSFFLLSVIFLYQWVILWEVVYRAVDGDRYPFTPWLLLFLGGTYFSLGENSGTHIDDSLGLTSMLTTIWVPQRSSIFGLAVCCVILSLFFQYDDAESTSEEGPERLMLAGFLLGLAPLVHAHMCLMTGLFVLLCLVWEILVEAERRRELTLQLVRFIAFASISLYALPFLMEKQSILAFAKNGFFPTKEEWGVSFWLQVLKNVAPLLLAGGVAWFFTRKHRYFVILIFLSLVAWFCRISVWEWDQLKAFIPLFVIVLMTLGRWLPKYYPVGFAFLVLLTFPSVYEVYVMIEKGARFEIFDKSKVSSALRFQEEIPKDAVLLAAPDHNTAAILTGRRLYLGYEGWLWSHGISYGGRKEQIKKLETALACNAFPCPDYLVWTEPEKRFWKRSAPPIGKTRRVTPTLYQLP